MLAWEAAGFRRCQGKAAGVRDSNNCVGVPTTFGKHCSQIPSEISINFQKFRPNSTSEANFLRLLSSWDLPGNPEKSRCCTCA